MTDPLALAIQAFNDIPNTRFCHPISRFRTSYELVAYLEEIRRHTELILEEVERDPANTDVWGDAYMYFAPVY